MNQSNINNTVFQSNIPTIHTIDAVDNIDQNINKPSVQLDNNLIQNENINDKPSVQLDNNLIQNENIVETGNIIPQIDSNVIPAISQFTSADNQVLSLDNNQVSSADNHVTSADNDQVSNDEQDNNVTTTQFGAYMVKLGKINPDGSIVFGEPVARYVIGLTLTPQNTNDKPTKFTQIFEMVPGAVDDNGEQTAELRHVEQINYLGEMNHPQYGFLSVENKGNLTDSLHCIQYVSQMQ